MNRTHAVAPASSSAAIQRKPAKGKAGKGKDKKKPMPQMGGSGKLDEQLADDPKKQEEHKKLEAAGFKQGDGKALNKSEKPPVPQHKPVTGQAPVKGAEKPPSNQAGAAKKSQLMAEGQVKKGAGEHIKKGGSPKPAGPTGKMVPGGGAAKASSAAKAGAAKETANKAGEAGAAKKGAAIDAQKGNPSKEPGKAAPDTKGEDKKAAEANAGSQKADATAKEQGGAGKDAKGDAKAGGKGDGAKDAKGGGKDAKAGQDAKGGGGKGPADEKKKAADEAKGALEKTPGKALDKDIADKVKGATGKDVSDAKVHTGPAIDKAAAGIGAEAYTAGKDIGLTKDAAGDKDTKTHEAIHVAQNAAGGGAAEGVSSEGDASEKEAEELTKAIGGGGAAQGGAKAGGAGVQRKAIQRLAQGASIQRATAPASTGGAGGAGGESKKKTITIMGKQIEVDLNVPSKSVTISGIPGVKSLTGQVKCAGGQFQGGELVLIPALPESMGGSVKVTVSNTGACSISGEASIKVNVKGLGTGTLKIGLAGSTVTGTGTIKTGELKLGTGAKITSGEATLTWSSTEGLSGSFKGEATFLDGKAKVSVNASYSKGKASGSASGSLQLEGMEKLGVGKTDFNLKYEGEKWSGDITVPIKFSYPGINGSATIKGSYANGKITASGEGEFDAMDGLLKGQVKAKIESNKINADLKLQANTFNAGPLEFSGVKFDGGLKNGELKATISGSVKGLGGKIQGTLSGAASSAGLQSVKASMSLTIPKFKVPKLDLSWSAGKGFEGEVKAQPDGIKGLEGEITIKYAGGALSGEGKLKLAMPPLKAAEVNVKYADGKITGSGKVDMGAINIPGCKIESSSIEAGFDGEKFSCGGSAQVSLAGGKVKGTLNAKYEQGTGFSGDIDANVNVPGLNPIALKLKLEGEKLSGEAETTLNIPYSEGVKVKVGYKDGKIYGSGEGNFKIPMLNSCKAKVELTPEGQVNGSLEIEASNISIPPLTVESPSIKGEIKDGKLSVSGGATVKGIPGCDAAKLEVKMGPDGAISGKIDAQLKIPGLKETKISLEYKDGKISGEVTVAAEFKGAQGSLKVKYDNGKWSGTGSIGFTCGKVSGKVEATLSEAGKLSGKGEATIKISDNLKATAGIELREDGTMKISGKIEVPSNIDLFKKEFEKQLFEVGLSFPIPGLSIPVINVGVVAKLSAGAKLKAGISAALTGITASGSWDTATDALELEIGGQLKGKAFAGISAYVEGSLGVDALIASVSGYIRGTATASIEAELTGGITAKYAGGALTFDINANASAGLKLDFGLSAGIKASVGVWPLKKTWDWQLAAKNFTYNAGGNLSYNPQFKYTFGKQPSQADLEPKQKPNIDGNAIMNGVKNNVKK